MENRSVTAAKATGDSKGDPASTSEHTVQRFQAFSRCRRDNRAEKSKPVFSGRRPSRPAAYRRYTEFNRGRSHGDGQRHAGEGPATLRHAARTAVENLGVGNRHLASPSEKLWELDRRRLGRERWFIFP